MSRDVLITVIHRFARQTRINGRLCLSANGDPALVAAFAAVGWADPHPLDAPDEAPAAETATITAPERAVLPKPKGKIG